MVDLHQHDELVGEIEGALRRFEKGAPPPLVARALLSELAASLAESNADEVGLSPRRLRAAREAAARGVEGLEAKGEAVQGREAKRALGTLCHIFREQATNGSRRQGLQRAQATDERPQARLPRWFRAALYVVLAACVAVLIVGRSSGVNPRLGTYSGYTPGADGGLKISFIVGPPTTISGVHHIEIVETAKWHGSCASGRIWVDETQSFYTGFSAWNSHNINYVTANVFGNYAHRSGVPNVSEHVHVVEDMGRRITPTRAAGLFNVSVALYQGGRRIDTCRTGGLRWNAHWVGY